MYKCYKLSFSSLFLSFSASKWFWCGQVETHLRQATSCSLRLLCSSGSVASCRFVWILPSCPKCTTTAATLRNLPHTPPTLPVPRHSEWTTPKKKTWSVITDDWWWPGTHITFPCFTPGTDGLLFILYMFLNIVERWVWDHVLYMQYALYIHCDLSMQLLLSSQASVAKDNDYWLLLMFALETQGLV